MSLWQASEKRFCLRVLLQPRCRSELLKRAVTLPLWPKSLEAGARNKTSLPREVRHEYCLRVFSCDSASLVTEMETRRGMACLTPYALRVAVWVSLLQSRLPEHTQLPHSTCLHLINFKFSHSHIQYFAFKAFCFHINTLVSISSTTTMPPGPLSHQRLLDVVQGRKLHLSETASSRSRSTLSSTLARITIATTIFCNAVNNLPEHRSAHRGNDKTSPTSLRRRRSDV